MREILKANAIGYLAAALIMLGLDGLWLSLTAHTLYRPLIGELMFDGFRLGPAIVFYLLYLCAIVIFAIRPAFSTKRWTTALGYGALFGLFAYGTYDLTNQATLKIWPTALSVADMTWGCVLTAVSSTGGYLVASKLTNLHSSTSAH
jgi:uncharacterized membrane protein